jgi:hypothetical protein
VIAYDGRASEKTGQAGVGAVLKPKAPTEIASKLFVGEKPLKNLQTSVSYIKDFSLLSK